MKPVMFRPKKRILVRVPLLLVLAVMVARAALVAAAEPPAVARRMPEAADPAAYWTPQRMRAARPRPMPEPAPEFAGAQQEPARAAEPVHSAPAVPPVVTERELGALLADDAAAPDATDDDDDDDEADDALAAPTSALPDAAAPASDVPTFVGTSGCHFSSSRLDPRTIDVSSGLRMHQVASGRCVSGGNNSERYGSDMRGGSSGGPWVQDFGRPATGQSVGPSGPNLIVGITSSASVSTAPKYQGSSIPDSRFTDILTTICNRDLTPPANCS